MATKISDGYTAMEGIVFRQTKTLNNRRMILLFSDEQGKISAGTSISENGKSKSALAMRPFTLSRFNIIENKGYFNIKSADTIKSYYKIGEDLDKFSNASYIMEFTEKLLPENVAVPKLFSLLRTYLDILEVRKKSFSTVTIAYMVKAMQISGVAPQLDKCIACAEANEPAYFHIGEGGFLCKNCAGTDRNNSFDKLLYKVNFDIVNVLNFLMDNPLKRVEKLELNPDMAKILQEIIKEYSAYHLDIGNIKSESMINM